MAEQSETFDRKLNQFVIRFRGMMHVMDSGHFAADIRNKDYVCALRTVDEALSGAAQDLGTAAYGVFLGTAPMRPMWRELRKFLAMRRTRKQFAKFLAQHERCILYRKDLRRIGVAS